MPQSRTRRPKGQSNTRRQPEISCTSDDFGGGVVGEGAGFSGSAFRGAVVPETRDKAKRKQRARLTRLQIAGTKRRMSTPLPPCPYLPTPRPGLDWRALHSFRDRDRGAEFYLACLEYGQTLWLRGFAARTLLCLDRAFGAELRGDEPVLQSHPLPYAAMAWLIANTPRGTFLGNPRVHFQHYADRMNDPRREQRRWRAWACWALTRSIRPELPSDPKHRVVEPTVTEIGHQLATHGLPGESTLWAQELARVGQASSAANAG
jgi:hypothetical protein